MKKSATMFISLALVAALTGCSTAPAATSASPAASQTAVVKLDGQKWINSDLIGSITADTAADPADDFAVYANKDWSLGLKFDASNFYMNAGTEREAEITEQITKLLTSGKLKGHDAETAAQYYNDLCDMDARNAAGVEPAKPYIEKILAIKNLSDLTAYLSDPDNVLATKLMTVTVVADSADSSKYAVTLAPDTLTLSDAAEYTSLTQRGSTLKTAGETMFTKFMEKFGMEESAAKERYAAILALETKLASAECTTAQTADASYYKASYNPVTMDELQKTAAAYPVAAVLKPYTDAGATNYVLTQQKWLAKLGELYTEENVEAWKDVLLLGMTKTLLNNSVLDQSCIDLLCEGLSATMGTTVKKDASELAFTSVNSSSECMKWAVGRVFAENCSSDKAKSDLTELVKKTIAVYRTRLEANTWLSDATKAKAIEKLDAMKFRVGYPDDWTPYEIADLNLKTKAEGGNALTDYETVTKYQLKKNIEKASKPVDKNRWSFAPQQTQAGYSPDDNSITFPAGKLGGAYFDDNGSDAANMGAIGCIIAHEISHAFDSAGSQYDKDGNMVNWWTAADAAAFKERTDKVAAYYSKLEPLEGIYLNGDMTGGENVADLGGMSCMLELAKSMKNFDYQTFFKSWANTQKQQLPAMLAETILRSDPHSPGYARINVLVQQFPEFYDAFGVKEGDNMYLAPADRLSVW